jgi:hypothetical protein
MKKVIPNSSIFQGNGQNQFSRHKVPIIDTPLKMKKIPVKRFIDSQNFHSSLEDTAGIKPQMKGLKVMGFG